MKEQLIDILRGGEAKTLGAMGMECEYLIVDDDYRAASYEAVARLLAVLAPEASYPFEEKGKCLGLRFDTLHLTLEPGSQLEISLDPCEQLATLIDRRDRMARRIQAVLSGEGLSLLAVGVQPVTPVTAIDLLPKDRYRWMHDYLSHCGPLAHTMMKATASLQITCDYADEADFVDKVRLLNLAGLFLATVLDNSPWWGGRPYDGVNARLQIWAACDDDRSMQPYGAFREDFGYAAYADFLLEVPPIFFDGRPTGKKTMADLAAPGDPKAAEHLMGMVFPFVRAKGYLELRTLDALPAPYDRAAVAFIKGLTTDRRVTKAALAPYAAVTEADYRGLVRSLLKKRDPLFQGQPVSGHLQGLIGAARAGLDEGERTWLDPLIRLPGSLMDLLGRDLAIRKEVTDHAF